MRGQHGSGHHATLGKDWRCAKPEQLQLWAVHGISLQQQPLPAAPGHLCHLIPLITLPTVYGAGLGTAVFKLSASMWKGE